MSLQIVLESVLQDSQRAHPQNAAMFAAYHAALNTFTHGNTQQGQDPAQSQAASASARPMTGQQPQQQQQQSQQAPQSNAPSHEHAPMYAIQAPPMLAYMPVLVSVRSTSGVVLQR